MLMATAQLRDEAPASEAALRLQRASGLARVAFKRRGSASVLSDLHQQGCCKLRFPRVLPGARPEAVLINTAGGLTDDDTVTTSAHWGADTGAVLTTQAAERIYRSRGTPARVSNSLCIDTCATAVWLPQETIFFDGGQLVRRLEADIASGGRLLACESIVFGRAAMGETVTSGGLQDIWRVRCDGRLVFADGLALSGRIDQRLDRPAIAKGARAIASFVYTGAGASALRDALRLALDGVAATWGCSLNGMVLVLRILADDGASMRSALRRAVETGLGWLNNETNAQIDGGVFVLPRVWSC